VGKIAAECRSAERGCVECKREFLSDLLEFLSPIRKRRAEILKNRKIVEEALVAGMVRAKSEATLTLIEAKRAMGLIA
jgi:tryptophanyl-tRNA synthetase